MNFKGTPGSCYRIIAYLTPLAYGPLTLPFAGIDIFPSLNCSSNVSFFPFFSRRSTLV